MRRSDRYIAVLIFIVTAAYLLLFRRYTSMDPDEGIVLQGAERILHGELLYRDFFSFFTPGSYYLVALVFKVFGDSFIVARTMLVLFGGVFSVMTYLLARRVCSRGSALTAAAIVSATCLPYRFMVLHNWDSTLWACLAVYCALRFTESGTLHAAFGAGFFTSLTFLFEQSKGGGLAIGLALGLILANFHTRTRFLRLRSIAAAIAGVSLPALVMLVWFYKQGAVQLMLSSWVWPLKHYSTTNQVPYGYQNWSDMARESLFGGPDRLISILGVSPLFILPVLPILAAFLFAYWVVQWRRGSVPEQKAAYYVVITSAILGLLVSILIGRPDIVHVMYMEPLFCIVLAWGIDGRDIPGQVFPKIKTALTAYITIAFLIMAASLLVRSRAGTQTVQTARGEISVAGEDTLIRYVREKVRPGERLLVYPYLPLYYYLTGTFSPVRYEYLQPGLHTPEQLHEVVDELSRQKVRTVLLEPSFSDKIPASWPNTPIDVILHDPVSDFILKHYRSCRVLHSPQLWRFLFMVRKDLPCPTR